jgi:hypothetical protein
MSHSLCVMGMYDEVKMTVPMIVRYVHNDKEKRNILPSFFHIPPWPLLNRNILTPPNIFPVTELR